MKLGMMVHYHRPECLMEKWDYCVQGQGHSSFQNVNECLSRWHFLKQWTFYYQTWYGDASLWVVPAGSPSGGGDVKVYVLYINQLSLPTRFTLFLCLFLSYCPFTCISFHKFSRQLSVFSLYSPSLISALLVLSTIYLCIKVSLNGFRDPAHLPCAATCVGGGRDPGDWGAHWLRPVGPNISLWPGLLLDRWLGLRNPINQLVVLNPNLGIRRQRL